MRSDAPKTQAGPKPGATEVCARALRAGQPRSPFGEGGGVLSRSLPDETSYSRFVVNSVEPSQQVTSLVVGDAAAHNDASMAHVGLVVGVEDRESYLFSSAQSNKHRPCCSRRVPRESVSYSPRRERCCSSFWYCCHSLRSVRCGSCSCAKPVTRTGVRACLCFNTYISTWRLWRCTRQQREQATSGSGAGAHGMRRNSPRYDRVSTRPRNALFPHLQCCWIRRPRS